MRPSTFVAALSTCALGLGLLTPAATAAEAVRAASASTCGTEALTKKKAVRTRSGARIGTAQAFPARNGDELGFCIRISPVPRLRTDSTLAGFSWKDFDAEGRRGSSGAIGGPGYWRDPFLLEGNIYETGSMVKGVAKIQVAGGPSGTAKLRATLV